MVCQVLLLLLLQISYSVFVLCLLLVMFQYHIIFNDHLTLCVAQRQSHFVCRSTTVSLCVLLNDRLTLCVAQRQSHFVCCSTTVSLCVLLNDHLTLCVAQRQSHFVCCSTTVSLCVSLNDSLTLCVAQRPSHFVCCSTTVSLCVAQRPSHFVCCSTTVSLCVLLNDHLTLCVAQRQSHFVCCSTTISLCVLQVHRPPVQVSVPAFWPLFQRPGVGRWDVQLSLSGWGTVLRGGRGRGENVQHVLWPRLVRVSSGCLTVALSSLATPFLPGLVHHVTYAVARVLKASEPSIYLAVLPKRVLYNLKIWNTFTLLVHCFFSNQNCWYSCEL